MSFFVKMKKLGSPAPPRTAVSDDNMPWPQDEFDDEEDDMYEVPPFERPVVKVPQTQVEANIYLGQMSSPAVPQRQAALLTRPGKALTHQQRTEDINNYPNIKKSPESDRNEKPGRKKMMPHPPVRPAAPVPASSTDEDVYLDPNEEREDNEDLYIEPTAALPPPPCEPMRIPLFPNIALVPPSVPLIKPPVPRVKSLSLSHSLNGQKPASSAEKRHSTFHNRQPQPTPSVKPLQPVKLKEGKLSPPYPLMLDSNPAALSSGMKATKQSVNEGKEWFAGDCNRKTAEDILLRVNKDGAFLIRQSSDQNTRQPYTLAALYQQKVYNIPIRFLEEIQGYALGKEGKKNQEIFGSLDEIISHHKNNHLLVIDSRCQAKHMLYLTHPTCL